MMVVIINWLVGVRKKDVITSTNSNFPGISRNGVCATRINSWNLYTQVIIVFFIVSCLLLVF